MEATKGLFEWNLPNPKRAAATAEKIVGYAKEERAILPEGVAGIAEQSLFTEIKDILALYKAGGLTVGQAASRKTYAVEVTYYQAYSELYKMKLIYEAVKAVQTDLERTPLEYEDAQKKNEKLLDAMNYILLIAGAEKGNADG